MARERDGRAAKTTFGIVDARSVKNADTAREKGYDAGKKVSGIKRHLTADTNGLPHAIHVATAAQCQRRNKLGMLAAVVECDAKHSNIIEQPCQIANS